MPQSFNPRPILILRWATPMLPVMVPGCAMILSAATAGHSMKVVSKSDSVRSLWEQTSCHKGRHCCSNTSACPLSCVKGGLSLHKSMQATLLLLQVLHSVTSEMQATPFECGAHCTAHRLVLNLRIACGCSSLACRACSVANKLFVHQGSQAGSKTWSFPSGC